MHWTTTWSWRWSLALNAKISAGETNRLSSSKTRLPIVLLRPLPALILNFLNYSTLLVFHPIHSHSADVMSTSVDERRRSPSVPLSVASTANNNEGPDTHALTTLLLEEKPSRAYEVEFNSRESTPFVMLIPPGIEQLKSEARAGRDHWAKFVGKSAADETRLSIPFDHYWKTEAKHYAESWSLLAAASMDQLDIIRRVTAEDLRYSISDIHYWQTEAIHYGRYANVGNYDHRVAPKPKHSAAFFKQPSGVRKSNRAVVQSKSNTKVKDAPVSSRLRSRNRATRTEVPATKSKKPTGPSSVLPHLQKPKRR